MEKNNGPVRALQMLFIAMLYGQIIFALIAFILVRYQFFTVNIEYGTGRSLETIAIIVSFAAVLLSYNLFKRRVGQAIQIVAPKEKFAEYRTACIIRYAIQESATLISLIFYLLTAKWNFIVIAIILIFIFMSQNPIRQRIKAELMVSDTDIDEMNKN